MPKNINDFFAAKEKVEEIDSHSTALELLHFELLRMLISKNVLNQDDVHEIFSNAVDLSSSSEEEMLQRMYELFTGPPDSDDEADLEDEDDDSENDS